MSISGTINKCAATILFIVILFSFCSEGVALASFEPVSAVGDVSAEPMNPIDYSVLENEKGGKILYWWIFIVIPIPVIIFVIVMIIVTIKRKK